jgi:hypothetical protein
MLRFLSLFNYLDFFTLGALQQVENRFRKLGSLIPVYSSEYVGERERRPKYP